MHLASTCVDRVAHLLRCLSLADHVLAYWWNADASNIQRLHLISFAASTCWKPLPGLASQYSERKNIIHIILDWGLRFKHTAKTYPKYCNKIICITWQHLIWWHHCPEVFYSSSSPRCLETPLNLWKDSKTLQSKSIFVDRTVEHWIPWCFASRT